MSLADFLKGGAELLGLHTPTCNCCQINPASIRRLKCCGHPLCRPCFREQVAPMNSRQVLFQCPLCGTAEVITV